MGNCTKGSNPLLSAFLQTWLLPNALNEDSKGSYYIEIKIEYFKYSGCSVARLSRLLWEQEAAGSNPATPTN
jgi:hypothetical protein